MIRLKQALNYKGMLHEAGKVVTVDIELEKKMVAAGTAEKYPPEVEPEPHMSQEPGPEPENDQHTGEEPETGQEPGEETDENAPAKRTVGRKRAFKEMLIQDLAVFMNTDECAELHDVNGRQLPVVIDQDILSGEGQEFMAQTAGIYTGRLMVFIKKTDLESVPVIDEVFRLDGQLYLVKNVAQSDGILEISLEANEI